MRWFPNIFASAVPPPNEGERAAGGFTDLKVSELERIAGGTGGAETLAVAVSAASLWERTCSALAIEDGGEFAAALTPHLLGIVGRSLAVYGNAVFAIVTQGGKIALIPASGYDIVGGPNPTTWRYRLDLMGSTLSDVIRTDAGSVLHFRVGADGTSPWHGTAPLRRSALTMILARRLEIALADEMAVPVSRTLGIGATKVVASSILDILGHRPGAVGVSVYADQANGKPSRVGPEPLENEVSLREQLSDQVYALFGLSPLLFSTDADGQSLREARRTFIATTLAGLTRMMENEIAAKLMAPGVRLSMSRLFVVDEETAALSTSRRASAFAKMVAGGVAPDRALQLSGLEEG